MNSYSKKIIAIALCGAATLAFNHSANALDLGGVVGGLVGGVGNGASAGGASAGSGGSSGPAASADVSIGGSNGTGVTANVAGIDIKSPRFGSAGTLLTGTEGTNARLGLNGTELSSGNGILDTARNIDADAVVNIGGAAKLTADSGTGFGGSNVLGNDTQATLGVLDIGRVGLDSSLDGTNGINVGLDVDLATNGSVTPPSNGGGSPTPEAVAQTFTGQQIATFKLSCRNILGNTASYDRDLIALCRAIKEAAL